MKVKPRAPAAIRAQTALHATAYRLSRGRVGRTVFRVPVLVPEEASRG
jgi:hypothetical protein